MKDAAGPADPATLGPPPRTAGTTLFQQIAVVLRDRIVSGQLPPGARLPSEAEICTAWTVSRITAKRALDLLAAEGLVTRARGRGTVVIALPTMPGTRMRVIGWRDSLLRLHKATEIELLDRAELPAPAHVARQLDLAPLQPVLRVVRLRRLDGKPLAHIEAWTPLHLAGSLSPEVCGETPLLMLLEQAGLRLGPARQTVGATAAAPDVAALLDCPPGAPLIDLRRRTLDVERRPVQLIRAQLRPDLYRIEMDLEAEGA